MERELYRARYGKWLFGVCTGMAEYMNLSAMTVRLIFAGMSLFFLAGVWMYLVCIFIIPKEPEYRDTVDEAQGEEE